jgi:hypothetical protein
VSTGHCAELPPLAPPPEDGHPSRDAERECHRTIPSSLSVVRFDPAHADFSLRALAEFSDDNPMKPLDIPQAFLDHFNIAVLANSVNLVLPEFLAGGRVPEHHVTVGLRV